MEIRIINKGRVECNGVECRAVKEQTPTCCDCPLDELFDKMFKGCDPLQCRKILCAGCEWRP